MFFQIQIDILLSSYIIQGLILKKKAHTDCEKGAQTNILANKIVTK